MSKAILKSESPKRCEQIANGKCTILLSKTLPKLKLPFKCYIYCTKSNGERLLEVMKDGDENYGGIYHGKTVFVKGERGSCTDMYFGRGKVIGEFVCDKVTRIKSDCIYSSAMGGFDVRYNVDLSATGLTDKELNSYLGEFVVEKYDNNYQQGYYSRYAWHISELKIYDTPKELREFKKCAYPKQKCLGDKCEYWGYSGCENALTRPPKGWCYVEELSE